MLKLVADDPWLEPYAEALESRAGRLQDRLRAIAQDYGSLRRMASAHQDQGFHYDGEARRWRYREWAPRARGLSLIGDFNGWDRDAHAMVRGEDGVWEIVLPDAARGPLLKHEDRVKVHVRGARGERDRIPALIRRAVQDPETLDYCGQIWRPEEAFAWTDAGFAPAQPLLIYEAHVGMAQEREGVGTYREFAEQILPRIARGGYTAVQLMAIQEHPYYASFGYHVSSFFAPSSRFGTPEDLKFLVNTAHELGLAALLDVVHSHAVRNLAEGLGEFDGEDGLYFHEGGRGYHTGWDSLLFDYGRDEVQRFLLSNLVYWLEEHHFDGFRFDGVTSMLYRHHGDHVAFDSYEKYFDEGVDGDAVLYLQLASTLCREIRPGGVFVAEDMSGMPGLCRPIEEGGMGFSHRLAMGIPDYWIRLLRHTRDEEWDLREMWRVLTNRRRGEATIAYAESHDQALVGDKTIAFWLMDRHMYDAMRRDSADPVIDRGVALHKMIRLVSLALGGEAYLNFMGNEFGHPEWIDFPREGNGWSYCYARRQWSLADDSALRYHDLLEFDRAMLRCVREAQVLGEETAVQRYVDVPNQTLVFERAGKLFAFNFHVERSLPDYAVPVPASGNWRVLLDSDAVEFGGFGRVDGAVSYPVFETERGREIRIYLPNRTGLVLGPAPDAVDPGLGLPGLPPEAG
ncbi:MAG TPA: alpha amylase C-terminal domain-containing protein [Verrucomicrobiales bacterium]|nr:alpha amylase C-terminal domain-containing protein [Verrucomicrobiales bacterium]